MINKLWIVLYLEDKTTLAIIFYYVDVSIHVDNYIVVLFWFYILLTAGITSFISYNF